jgi:putative PIG3 family NAD(P)H quinone oxidoreductase
MPSIRFSRYETLLSLAHDVRLEDVVIAATVPRPGGPEVFVLEDRPIPTPGSGEVLIRVVAAGVNRADILQREGRYPPPLDAADWPGLEVAGTIASVGSGVVGWDVGDDVCALLGGGGYAEYAVTPASLVLPVPVGLSLIEAASLVEAAATVWSTLEAADAKTGDRVLIHGGSGGVGAVAIQMGRDRGLDVTVTARGPERTERCRALGASRAVDYQAEDFVDVAKERGGFDIIVDVLGGLYLERNIAALAIGGRLVVIGLQAGAHGTADLAALLQKRARIIGSTLRSRPLSEKSAIVADLARDVWPRIPVAIRPVVHATFPLERVSDAHRTLESGEVFGKVVLTVGV